MKEVIDKKETKEHILTGEFVIRDPKILWMMSKIAEGVNVNGVLILDSHLRIESYRENGKKEFIQITKDNMVYVPLHRNYTRKYRIDLEKLEAILRKIKNQRFIEVKEYETTLKIEDKDIEVKKIDIWETDPRLDVRDLCMTKKKGVIYSIQRGQLEEALRSLIDLSKNDGWVDFSIEPSEEADEKPDKKAVMRSVKGLIELENRGILTYPIKTSDPIASPKLDPLPIYIFLSSLPREISEITIAFCGSALEFRSSDLERGIEIKYVISNTKEEKK